MEIYTAIALGFIVLSTLKLLFTKELSIFWSVSAILLLILKPESKPLEPNPEPFSGTTIAELTTYLGALSPSQQNTLATLGLLLLIIPLSIKAKETKRLFENLGGMTQGVHQSLEYLRSGKEEKAIAKQIGIKKAHILKEAFEGTHPVKNTVLEYDTDQERILLKADKTVGRITTRQMLLQMTPQTLNTLLETEHFQKWMREIQITKEIKITHPVPVLNGKLSEILTQQPTSDQKNPLGI